MNKRKMCCCMSRIHWCSIGLLPLMTINFKWLVFHFHILIMVMNYMFSLQLVLGGQWWYLVLLQTSRWRSCVMSCQSYISLPVSDFMLVINWTKIIHHIIISNGNEIGKKKNVLDYLSPKYFKNLRIYSFKEFLGTRLWDW